MRLPTQPRLEAEPSDSHDPFGVTVAAPRPGITGRRRAAIWGGLLLALAGASLIVHRSHVREQADTRDIIRQAALEAGIDPDLAEAIVHAESGGNHMAKSRAGAYGLMQLMPPTANEVAGRKLDPEELFDPRLNASLGCRYVRRLQRAYDDDLLLTLMAYNAGMGRVAKWRAIDPSPRDVLERHAFGETRAYVRKVLARYRELKTR